MDVPEELPSLDVCAQQDGISTAENGGGDVVGEEPMDLEEDNQDSQSDGGSLSSSSNQSEASDATIVESTEMKSEELNGEVESTKDEVGRFAPPEMGGIIRPSNGETT